MQEEKKVKMELTEAEVALLNKAREDEAKRSSQSAFLRSLLRHSTKEKLKPTNMHHAYTQDTRWSRGGHD